MTILYLVFLFFSSLLVAQQQIVILPHYFDSSKKNAERVIVSDSGFEYALISQTVWANGTIEQATDIFSSLFFKHKNKIKEYIKRHMVYIHSFGDLVIYAVPLDDYDHLQELFDAMQSGFSSMGAHALVENARMDKELFGRELDSILKEVMLCLEVRAYLNV